MASTALFTKTIALSQYGIKNATIHYQLDAQELHQICVENGQGKTTTSGALAINTGKFTGRSPKDRFIVIDELTRDEVWWGDINIPFDKTKFDRLRNKMQTYLSDRKLYVRDAYACADSRYKLGIRVINEHAWSNLFAHNMFLRPNDEALENFKEDWLILNAPGFKANPEIDGTRQENFAIISFEEQTILIGGTGYTGEIKKGIFSVLNFLLPTKQHTLPMHCSANIGENGETAIFFGLSGTGKTTLSADPRRKLIGDDEHGWTPDNTIFNFEGGCYAKVINLSKEQEPDIFGAIKEGALLENVVLDKNKHVDYTNTTITQNTRVSYPIHHIKNIQVPSIGHKPKNIFFLTADAFGVLPPISKLTPGQAAYHFISGYTAKVAGTEAGVTEPTPSFSACFGAPFMPLHPTRYAEMLIAKMKETGVNVWLINTGWTGGPYGVGKRMALKYTRAMINAALNNELGEITHEDYHIHSVFGVAQPRTCPGVPDTVLSPRQTWNDDEGYYKTAHKLAAAFKANFKKYESYASEAILKGQPPLG